MAATRPDQADAGMSGCETIEQLFAELESPLLGYAQRLTGEPGTAEDLVQEAFMKLHAQFDNVREPRKWLYRTVHNLALNNRRASNKIIPLGQPAEDGSSTGPDTTDPQPLPDEQ